MSRPRQYPVGGTPGPLPAELPVPSKDQILTILDSARDGTMTRPALLLASARLFGLPPDGITADEGIKWARTVMGYAATERLLDRMVRDGMLVGKEAHEWAALGHRVGGAQARTTYFMSARRALAVADRNEIHRDESLWDRAGAAADAQLRSLHMDQWAGLRQGAYDALCRGVQEKDQEKT